MTAAPAVRCPCGHTYSRAAWRALPTVATLTGGDVHAYVVGWPADCLVEVRACHRCDRRIARTMRQDDARETAG